MTIMEAAHQFAEHYQLSRSAASIRGYRQDLAQFALFLGDAHRDVRDITAEECRRWQRVMLDVGYHPNCVGHKTSTLRAFFSFLRTNGIDTIPAEALTAPKLHIDLPHVASDSDFEALLRVFQGRGYAHKRNRALLLLIHDSFARAGEITSLNVTDIDLEHRCAVLRTEKSRFKFPFREIYWTESTNEALRIWIDARRELIQRSDLEDTGALFIGVKRGSSDRAGKRMSSNSVADLFRRYSVRAGLTHTCNAHSFRHRGGRELCKAGANSFAISSLLGHSDPSSSFRYTQLYSTDREKIYRDNFG